MIGLMFVISALLCSNFISHAVGRNKGLPDSISAIVFGLRHPWAWSVWLWSVTVTLAPSLFEAMPDEYRVFAFLTVALLAFIGAFPLFDKEHVRWHYILGLLSGVFSQACVWYICPWFLLLWIVMCVYIVAGIAASNDKKEDSPYDGKGVIIAELIAIVAVYSSITIKLYL